MKPQAASRDVLRAATNLMDWVPLSETRALRWASDLLTLRAGPDEPPERAVERVTEAAMRTARTTRDVRYHDLYSSVVWLIKQEVEAKLRAKQDLDRKAIAPLTGGVRSGAIAVGIFTDIATKLLRSDDYETEFEFRRSLTDEQIRERRDALQQEAENRREAERSKQ